MTNPTAQAHSLAAENRAAEQEYARERDRKWHIAGDVIGALLLEAIARCFDESPWSAQHGDSWMCGIDMDNADDSHPWNSVFPTVVGRYLDDGVVWTWSSDGSTYTVMAEHEATGATLLDPIPIVAGHRPVVNDTELSSRDVVEAQRIGVLMRNGIARLWKGQQPS